TVTNDSRRSVPVDHYNIKELKTAMTEGIARYFNSDLKLTEDHTFIDRHLILGYLGAIIAGATFYYSWGRDFQEHRDIAMVASVIYFILTGLMMFQAYFIQGDIVYLNKPKPGQDAFKVKGNAFLKEYQPTYTLTIELNDKTQTETFNLAEVFDDKGRLVFNPLDDKIKGLIQKLKTLKE
ncbi:hypothetical protein CONCODRAFT_80246, partial [Conidiobolus coronatus NRRL 28638]